MALTFGTARGAAYRHDWNASMNRLAQNTDRIQQAEAVKQEKARYYADKFKLGNPTNEWDRGQYEQFVTGINKEIGEFVASNPNWESDIGAMAKFNQITDRYLNNDVLIRDQRVSAQAAALEDWASKNSISDDDGDLVRMREELDNYYNTGNIYGAEGADVKEFRFVKPADIDATAKYSSNALMLEKGRKVEKYIEGGMWGTRKEVVGEEKLRASIEMLYQNDKDAWDREYRQAMPGNRAYAIYGDIPEHEAKMRYMMDQQRAYLGEIEETPKGYTLGAQYAAKRSYDNEKQQGIDYFSYATAGSKGSVDPNIGKSFIPTTTKDKNGRSYYEPQTGMPLMMPYKTKDGDPIFVTPFDDDIQMMGTNSKWGYNENTGNKPYCGFTGRMQANRFQDTYLEQMLPENKAKAVETAFNSGALTNPDDPIWAELAELGMHPVFVDSKTDKNNSLFDLSFMSDSPDDISEVKDESRKVAYIDMKLNSELNFQNPMQIMDYNRSYKKENYPDQVTSSDEFYWGNLGGGSQETNAVDDAVNDAFLD